MTEDLTGQAPAEEYWFREGCHILEWLNSADDPAVSVARARVPAGSVTRWHRLQGITERYLILSGHGEADIGDGAPQPVGVGSVVHIPSGERQRIRNTGSDELVFLAVCTPRFTPERYEDCDN
ncbi:cupin domain-containing protein [uncultured Abyssibacter sp.]|uniref:cupin domain-containing protein n=1 Tax=uncultured Abyssibacter sp. TaxID=2320202 RepID=UPI0032B1E685|tara:strand:- start:135 stop:503 length:369 start_codon:yes stop_codon:yes gene_type:complete